MERIHSNSVIYWMLLLVGEGSVVGVGEVTIQEEFEETQEDDTDLDKKVIKLGELHKPAYEDLVISINPSSAVGIVAFGLVRKSKKFGVPCGKLQNSMG